MVRTCRVPSASFRRRMLPSWSAERGRLERGTAIAVTPLASCPMPIISVPSSASARKANGALRRLQAVGQPLDLSGTTVDGKKLSLRDFKGKPVLLHYWATWCEPCKVDIARIRELQEKYQRDIVVVGIALDGDKAALQRFLQSKPLTWPQLYEQGGLDGRLAEELGVLTLPTMLLLDKEGVVVERNLMVTDLEASLNSLLNK